MNRRAFTLTELLAAVAIVGLVSAVTLPVVLPAFRHREVSEAGRILQAALAGARDRAVRANAPRGIRLLPDETLAASGLRGWSRLVELEPAPDYALGSVSVKPLDQIVSPTAPFIPGVVFPAERDRTGNSPQPWPLAQNGAGVLVLEAEPVRGGTGAGPGAVVPNEAVNWWWNVRVGDRIQVGGEGAYYTVVGPLEIRPTQPDPKKVGNPELFVNVGWPGAGFANPGGGRPGDSPLWRAYGDPGDTFVMPCQFLYLVNGQDDDGDGYVDNGWDGVDNDLSLVADDFGEWEPEQWTTAVKTRRRRSLPTVDLPYRVTRRPVPAPGSAVTTLPAKVVIDGSPGRSVLPADPATGAVDILIQPTGQVVPTTPYSSPSSVGLSGAFLHFWLSERSDVGTGAPPAGECLLLSLWGRSGQVLASEVADFADPYAGARMAVEAPE